MSSLYFMIPLGLLVSALAIWLFMWALRGGQFEDLDSPGWSIIMDEEQIAQEQTAEKSQSSDDISPASENDKTNSELNDS